MNFLSQSLTACFPRSMEYRLPARPAMLHESAVPIRPFPYTERHLQSIWADPRHRPTQLRTSDGESITVEHPGDWNLEAGPDFNNAVLLIGKEKRRVCGDLEIHIHANAWHQHGHGNDPRYDNVRFHVVYFQGTEVPGLIQIPLQEGLSSDPHFSFENIDTTAYPYSIPAGDFPLKSLHPDKKILLLESAGEERLRLKTARLSIALQSKESDQVLWEELMAALGYKNNKSPFRQLAVRLPLARLRMLATTTDKAYALLLGLSGLLPTHPDPTWNTETRTFVRNIWDCWWKQSEELKELALAKSDWTLSGIRPANHPVRRLMAAAHYAFRIPDIVHDEKLLTHLPDNFWNSHSTWKTECPPTALVGQSRANAVITNILIPFRAVTGALDLHLDQLPVEPTNSIIRQTAHALFGPDHTPKVYRSALARQGLIQIFHDYLITHRLDELKSKFGGTASPLSVDDEDIAPPKGTTTQAAGVTSPLPTDDENIVLPNDSATQTGGTTSPLSATDKKIVPYYPIRRHPAHHPPIEHPNKMPIIFLTVCTHQRRAILANQDTHKVLIKAWNASSQWIVGRYVVMPDHIHLFCSPSQNDCVSVADWTSYWKRLVSQQFPDLQPLWQRDCWDTQLRSHESYAEKWEYVRNNPIRAKLVSSYDQWPYQGTLNNLTW